MNDIFQIPQRYCVLTSGEIVVHGGHSEFQLLTLDNRQTSIATGLCEHDIAMLPIVLNNKERLAISCEHSHKIQLIDVKSGEISILEHKKAIQIIQRLTDPTNTQA